ncbi:MAG TPA: hypothetical protein VFN68_02350 [Acidimicrobiales bacterium]|nr:hypothetical protein [Acidimicrobiales bacterium]
MAGVALAATALFDVGVGSAASAATVSAAQTSSPATISYTTSSESFTSRQTVNWTTVQGEVPSGAVGTPVTGTPAKKQRLGRPHPTGNRGTPITAGSNYLVRGNVPGESGFTGVTSPQSAAVNVPPAGITPFSDVEPPDQGTCAGPDATGSPIIFDFVNDAASAYTPGGTTVWQVTPAWAMFGLQPSAFLSDPRCYFDAQTQRWFFTMFTVGSPAPSTQYIAVSQTSDPLGNYTVFGFDTTDANNPLGDCPCFGDYDMIGADANGFYITTNEFSNISNPAGTPFYNGTVLYAVSKQGLVAAAADGGATAPPIARYQVTGDPYGYSADASGGTPAQNNGPYHVSPASTPSDGTYAPNTEYFAESNSDLFSDNHLIVYALNQTDLLATGGTPPLTAAELTSEPYAFPPNAVQKNGPLPLGSTYGWHRSAPELQADFNALQETTYSAGQLYTELDTATVTSSDAGHAGVAWFDLTPSVSPADGTVTASVAHQGYVATGDSLLYPDMVVNGSGNGYLDFSMSGHSDYPSAAYVTLVGGQPTGDIHLAAAGAAPEDGFTCYPPFASPSTGCRWGDYSAGAVYAGQVYMMTEYIPPTPRDTDSNWGTFVWSAPTP